jgi:hypothetical protein
MIGRKDMKQETMAKRTRDRAMGQKMVSPRKKMDMGMSPGPDMGMASAPPMMPPAGMKKGGMAKKPLAYTMKKGGMAKKPAAKKGMKKGGMMLIIGIGKKKGK